MDNQGLSDLSLVKALAANDRASRDRAVEKLRQYLSFRQVCSETEFLKIWKGLFYCMWMSDRPLTQQRLASDLAGLVDSLDVEAAIPFLSAFWKTMAREWRGIDVLRMNKFLLLVRLYFRASINYFMQRGLSTTTDSTNPSALGSYIDVLAEIPLNPTDAKIPDGLRYHMIDIYVDELDAVDSDRESGMPLEMLLGPVRLLGRQSHNRIIRKRVKEMLQDPRLENWSKRGSEEIVKESEMQHQDRMEGLGDVDEWNGFDD